MLGQQPDYNKPEEGEMAREEPEEEEMLEVEEHQGEEERPKEPRVETIVANSSILISKDVGKVGVEVLLHAIRDPELELIRELVSNK